MRMSEKVGFYCDGGVVEMVNEYEYTAVGFGKYSKPLVD